MLGKGDLFTKEKVFAKEHVHLELLRLNLGWKSEESSHIKTGHWQFFSTNTGGKSLSSF